MAKRATFRITVAILLSAVLDACYPARSTFYDAVDQPWSTDGDERIINCPSSTYWSRPFGETSAVLTASYRTGNIEVVIVGRVHLDELENVRLEFRSLDDAEKVATIPVEFMAACASAATSADSRSHCTTLSIPQARRDRDGNIRGRVAIPQEFASGFSLRLLGELSGRPLPFNPQIFKLKSKVLVQGTFACGVG